MIIIIIFIKNVLIISKVFEEPNKKVQFYGQAKGKTGER